MMQKLSKREKLERLVGKEVIIQQFVLDELIYAKGTLVRKDDPGKSGYYLSGAFNFQIPMKSIVDFSRMYYNKTGTGAIFYDQIIVDFEGYEIKDSLKTV